MIRFFPAKHQKILKISIPAALNSLMDMLQVITDLIMVGRISAFAVAAVGLGLQSLMFVFAVITDVMQMDFNNSFSLSFL